MRLSSQAIKSRAYLEKRQVLSRTWLMSSWGKHAGQVASVAHPLVEYSILASASSTTIVFAAPWVTSIASKIDVDDERALDIMVVDCTLWVMTP